MESKELFLEDGKSAGIYFCSKCRIVAKDKAQAEECCKPYRCDTCGKETSRYWTRCDSCRDSARLKNAQEVFDWQGWIYCDELESHNDGFFESAEELVEYCEDLIEDDDEFVPPEWCFATNTEPFPAISTDDAIQRACDDGFEGIEDEIKGLDELKLALDKFAEVNQSLVSYHPDYSRKVKVPKINKRAK